MEHSPAQGALTSISHFPNAALRNPPVLGLSVAGLRMLPFLYLSSSLHTACPFSLTSQQKKISREELELHSSYLLYYLNVKPIFLLHSLQKIDSMVALTALSYRNHFHLSERFCSISYNNVVLNLHLRKKKMVLGKNPAAKIENSKMFYDNSLKWNYFSIKNPLKVKWNLPAQRQISRDSITETACNPLI